LNVPDENCKDEMIIYPPCTDCKLAKNTSIFTMKKSEPEDLDFWLVIVLEISLVLALVILSWHYGSRKRVEITRNNMEADHYQNL